MCDLTRSYSSRSYTKSFNLTVPRNSSKQNTKDNLVSTGSQTEVNASSKRPSVQFSTTVFGLNDPEDDEEHVRMVPGEDDHLPELLSSSKSSWNKGTSKRESIFSIFSQVASGSQRPSIFSRLSSQTSNTSSLYTWNYSIIFLIIFFALVVLILGFYFIISIVLQKYTTI